MYKSHNQKTDYSTADNRNETWHAQHQSSLQLSTYLGLTNVQWSQVPFCF